MSGLFGLFVVTGLINALSPGLGVVMVLMLAAQYGWKRTMWAGLGLTLGIAFLFVLVLSGLGVVLQNSPLTYAAVKCVGAGYLMWMGVRTLRAADSTLSGYDANLTEARAVDLFARGFLLNVSNPQPLMFAVSVVPQFVDVSKAYVPQATLLGTVYVGLVLIVLWLYALLADRACLLLKGPNAVKVIRIASGVVFCLIGVYVLYRALVDLLPFLQP